MQKLPTERRNTMKRISVLALATIALVGLVFAATPACADGRDDVNQHKQCKHCGMDRGHFDFSRMLIEYDDGTVAAVCSLHCAATELANNIDKTPKSIKVGDFGGKQLIEAEKAVWVIGGNKPGVMSKRGKWAFEKKEDAETFVKSNQGALASFDEALKAAYADMAEDTMMIREKRQMKRKMMEEHNHGDNQ
jgi:copper chaperone NosL